MGIGTVDDTEVGWRASPAVLPIAKNERKQIFLVPVIEGIVETPYEAIGRTACWWHEATLSANPAPQNSDLRPSSDMC